MLSTYNKVDTTNIKPKLKFDDFKKWYDKNSHWYEFMENTLREYGRKVEVIYYDDFTKGSDTSNLNTILAHFEKLGIAIDKPEAIKSVYFVRQDKNNNYATKVDNWEEFYNDAVEKGLENSINDYFNEEKDYSKLK